MLGYFFSWDVLRVQVAHCLVPVDVIGEPEHEGVRTISHRLALRAFDGNIERCVEPRAC